MLEISVAAGAAGPVILLSGEVDLTNAAALGEALAAQVSGGARHLTVDLSGLRFADSASVPALVALQGLSPDRDPLIHAYQGQHPGHPRLRAQHQDPAPLMQGTGLLPHATVKIYPDAAHGFLFQHHAQFAVDVTEFLN